MAKEYHLAPLIGVGAGATAGYFLGKSFGTGLGLVGGAIIGYFLGKSFVDYDKEAE